MGKVALGEEKGSKMPMIGFRVSKSKKEYLEKTYGKELSSMMREYVDTLIVRTLKIGQPWK